MRTPPTPPMIPSQMNDAKYSFAIYPSQEPEAIFVHFLPIFLTRHTPPLSRVPITSEFVVEGENVEKGQSIGTVGNTAVFEVADEPHLHFEILKESIPQDPNSYLK